MDFTYGTACKLPTLSKTGTEEVRDFLNQIEAYWDLLSADGRKLLIKFVCKAKITEIARTR
jgi:hypothetical protein